MAWWKNLSKEDLGQLVKDYLEDSEHDNWPGYEPAEVLAIRELLKDMKRYYEADWYKRRS